MSESLAVVITCFNLERYVGEAIQSVLAQDIGLARIDEIVVVDDCSTDGSAAVIKNYPNVTYLRTESNSGVLLATLAGIAATRSELIFFLDGDDVWEPAKLRKAVEVFEGGVGLVTHDLTYVDQAGQLTSADSRVAAVMQQIPPRQWGDAVLRGIRMYEDYVWLGSAYAIRRSTSDIPGFLRFGKSLPDARNTYQDWPLAFWVANQSGVRAGYVPHKLFRYRLHGANHSGDATTPAKAIRNLRRALNTMDAVNRIAHDLNAPIEVRSRVATRLIYTKYLVDLYEGKRMAALRGLAASASYIRGAGLGLLREAARFLGVAALGVSRFTWLVARLRSAGVGSA